MTTINIDVLETELKAWRQDLHAHPEFGFEEHRTARFVADKLRAFGLDDVVEGVGGTGVVGTLTGRPGGRATALRADMDALQISEAGTCPHRSTKPGLMHACGHDGHTAMLLGAAKLLAHDRDFAGVVRFVFQPAEEWGRGALAMLNDGLLERFPFDEIYGVHNMPGLAVGRFETRPGPLMAAEDNFEIVLRGVGGHASRPHTGSEVLVAACALVTSLQTIVSRRVDPAEAAVVSVTELVADGTRNVLPGHARILGDARSFKSDVSATIEAQMRAIAGGIALAYNVEIEVSYTREFVPLVNDPEATVAALLAAETVFGASAVHFAEAPITVAEDFARFLEHRPGCFALIGNGVDSLPLHNARYDFSDANLVLGARYFAQLVRRP